MQNRYSFRVDMETEEGRTEFSNNLEFDALTLDDVLGNFELFLKGAGFVFTGHLEIVPNEPWDDIAVPQTKRPDDSEGGLIE